MAIWNKVAFSKEDVKNMFNNFFLINIRKYVEEEINGLEYSKKKVNVQE